MANRTVESHDLFEDIVEARDAFRPGDERDVRKKRIAKLRLLWAERRFLGRATLSGLLLFALIAFLIPSRYRSTATLMPPDQNSNSGLGMLATLVGRASSGGATSSDGAGLSGIASDVLGLKGSGALFVGILQSRTVQDDLVSKFDLRKLYRDRRWEDARDELEANTDVEENRKSELLSVSVTDKSPQRAAAMASEYVEELNRVVTQLNTSSAHREREFLEGRLQEVTQDLEAAEKDFSEFASKNAAINIPEQGKAMIEAAASLEGQLIATQTELESLRQIYTDTNVRVRAMQARVDELQRQLQKLGGQPGADDSTGNQDDQSLYPSIRRLPVLGVNYADLYRHTKVEEAVFETLTQEYELAKVEEAKETPSVKVLDPANVPEKKSFPPRLWITFGGTLLSFTAGIVWILSESSWQKIDPQDPGKVFAQEVFASIKSRVRASSSNGSGDGVLKQMFSKGLRTGHDAPSGFPGSRTSEGKAPEEDSSPSANGQGAAK
jgi:uncharacterized protein involved in exopolysaccharide biosynthesis